MKKSEMFALVVSIVLMGFVVNAAFGQPLEPLAPMGTSKCDVVEVCDQNGLNCRWITICR